MGYNEWRRFNKTTLRAEFSPGALLASELYDFQGVDMSDFDAFESHNVVAMQPALAAALGTVLRKQFDHETAGVSVPSLGQHKTLPDQFSVSSDVTVITS